MTFTMETPLSVCVCVWVCADCAPVLKCSVSLGDWYYSARLLTCMISKVIRHNPPRSESPIQWQGQIKPTESHIVTVRGVLNQGYYVRGVYVRQSWNLAFRTPFPVHSTLCTGGFSLALSVGIQDPTVINPAYARDSGVTDWVFLSRLTGLPSTIPVYTYD